MKKSLVSQLSAAQAKFQAALDKASPDVRAQHDALMAAHDSWVALHFFGDNGWSAGKLSSMASQIVLLNSPLTPKQLAFAKKLGAAL